MHNIRCTVAMLRAVLCYINPKKTEKIAFDGEDISLSLIKKIKEIVGENDGSTIVEFKFDENEEELARQFTEIVAIIRKNFVKLSRILSNKI